MVLFFDPKKINLIEIHDRQVSRASKNRVTPSKGRYQKIYIMQNYTIVRASSLNFGKHKISTVYPYSPSLTHQCLISGEFLMTLPQNCVAFVVGPWHENSLHLKREDMAASNLGDI